MKKFFVLIAIAFSILFFACEDETIPIPLPPSQPAANAPAEEGAASQAPAEKPSEPAKTAKESAKTPAKEIAKTTVSSVQNGDVEQSSTGRYVIQVSVLPVEASAKKLIKKLAENGIKAYSAKVQDPDPSKGVIGTYYRVRIGFFDGRSVAETFAKTRLEPIGYAWWIDKSKNDNIGCTMVVSEPEPFFIEKIPEPEPKQISEQEKKDAERAAAIAAAKEEYKAIAKAATAAPAIPPPTIPEKDKTKNNK